MALSGIQIYKLLPQTNCKECGFPTCLAFAMKLAAKQVELSACPYVSEASKAQLAESAAPPMRLVTLKSDGHEVKVGNEVVLFRHEKTFYNRPGVFIKVRDDAPVADVKAKVEPADKFIVSYVGIDLTIDGIAVEATGDPDRFAAAIKAVREVSKRPIVLISPDAKVVAAGLQLLKGETPLISGADAGNWEAMADLAKASKAALVVKADSIDALADLTEKIKARGVEDLVIDPETKNLGQLLTFSTQVRRLALKKNVRSVGFPIVVFAGEPVLAAQAVAKYGGFVVLDEFKPETVYPLLVLRQNIYTDPQKPIQVQPGLYEINNPTARIAGAGHDELQHHLLQRGERSGKQRFAGVAARHRCGRHERAHGVGRRQVRRRAHCEGREDLQRRR